MIYTTNPVEALHRILRKLIKGKAAWVSDIALLKQIYLSLMHNEKSWKRNAFGWKSMLRNYLMNIHRFYHHFYKGKMDSPIMPAIVFSLTLTCVLGSVDMIFNSSFCINW